MGMELDKIGRQAYTFPCCVANPASFDVLFDNLWSIITYYMYIPYAFGFILYHGSGTTVSKNIFLVLGILVLLQVRLLNKFFYSLILGFGQNSVRS